MASSEAIWSGSTLFAKVGVIVNSRIRVNIFKPLFLLLLFFVVVVFFIRNIYTYNHTTHLICKLLWCKLFSYFKSHHAKRELNTNAGPDQPANLQSDQGLHSIQWLWTLLETPEEYWRTWVIFPNVLADPDFTYSYLHLHLSIMQAFC